MPPKTLPQELIENIIDTVLLDDVDTFSLSIISRVAQAWRPRSQAIIFRNIDIPDPYHLGRFKALLSGSPHLAPYVQRLRLGAGDISEYCEISNNLTNVSELTLRDIPLRGESSLRSLDDLLSSLPSLSSLSLRECAHSPTVVQVIFNSCTSLKAISFESCPDDPEPTILPFTSLAAPPSLQSIACDDHSAAVLNSLAMCTFGPGLPTHLYLGPGTNYEIGQLRLLQAVKDRLESLELLMPYWWSVRWEGLPSCNNLQVLTLDIDRASTYLPYIVPNSILTFRELRIIFTKHWQSTSTDNVFVERAEEIEKIGMMAVERGVQKVVWKVRRMDEYHDVVDQSEFRGQFEGRMRDFMALPDGKCQLEFLWEKDPECNLW